MSRIPAWPLVASVAGPLLAVGLATGTAWLAAAAGMVLAAALLRPAFAVAACALNVAVVVAAVVAVGLYLRGTQRT